MSKSDGHGIGMRSIKAFSDKYKSNVSCSLEYGWFSVILFINEYKMYPIE
ncbi:MAG: GHKL domain-containing protein [Bacilli bacterium]